MTVERTEKEIVIRIPISSDMVDIERLIDYLKFREIASKSKATQEQIDKLARESKAEWWRKNQDPFIKNEVLSRL
jgi:hypothetical protein